MKRNEKPLVVTAGEPAGIGPELCLAIAAEAGSPDFVVVSDAEMLRERAAMLDFAVEIRSIEVNEVESWQPAADMLAVLHVPFPERVSCGTPLAANAQTLLDGLRLAVAECGKGNFAALVTAPLAKSVINDAGIAFTGHTEFLAESTNSSKPVMLLVAGDLRVALASTHMPLRDVPDYLTSDGLREVLLILNTDLKSRFGIDEPEIVVCGLNPHAGENGHLGQEDKNIIAPIVRELSESGLKIRGPMPADTAFTPAAGHHDAILAMYHDQGLPVLKYAGFGNAVNVTLGLPIIRTSVDHGTAFNLAGTGKADTGSLRAAIELAREIAGRS